jgi:hypothetical protein
MIKKLALAISMVAIVATATGAEAAKKKPHEHCEWVKQPSANLMDWFKGQKRHKKKEWVCHERNGTVSGNSASGVSRGAPNSPGTNSNTNSGTNTATVGKGNNGLGTPNGSKTDGGDPPGVGNNGNDGPG